MAWLVPDDFRAGSADEVCRQLELTDAEADDNALQLTIERLEGRLEDHTNDNFTAESLTLEMTGDATTRLDLPRRCQGVSMVELVDAFGVVTLQDPDAYHLKSSLYAAGTKRSGDYDWIDAIRGSVGLTSGGYLWPTVPFGVHVTGVWGWSSPPEDMRRALALLTYDHFKPLRADLRRTLTWRVEDASMDAAQTTPTGIPEVDTIIATYRRDDDLVMA